MKSNHIAFTCKALATASCVAFLAITHVADAGTAVSTKTWKEVAPMSAEEPEPWWSAELQFGWDSLYIFRGVKVIPGSLVWTDLSATFHGFTVGAWYANGVTADYNELNAYASYTHSLGPVDLTAGYIYYLLPRSNNFDTHELFAGLDFNAVELPWFSLTPSIYYYHDVDKFDGGYLEGAISTSFTVIPDRVSIDPYASLSVDFKYNSNKNALNHFQYGVNVPISLTDNITLNGHVSATVPLDAIDDFETERVWAGASVSFAF